MIAHMTIPFQHRKC